MASMEDGADTVGDRTDSQQSTVEKAIDVLYHLHAANAACGVTAIGRELSMPKSSVHRLLTALARRDLVERDERGRYRPGFGLVALGLGVLEQEPVVVAAGPILETCAREVGETFFLVAARADSLIVLAKAEGTGFLRASPTVGSAVPVHATAVGKLYLAFGDRPFSLDAPEEPGELAEPEEPSDEIVLESFTDRTLTRAEALRAEVRAVRETGHASNRDEWISGLSVLAAPVWRARRLVAAIAVALPSVRMNELGAEQLTSQVSSAAERVTLRLEGAGAGGKR